MRSALFKDFAQRRLAFLTDVSGQTVGPILQGQGVQVVSQAFQVLDCLAADSLSRNVGKKPPFYAA